MVAGLVDGEEPFVEPRPCIRVTGGSDVLLLEPLVTPVVGNAGGEVGPARRLHHAIGEQPADAHRLERTSGGEFLGGHHPLSGHEPAVGSTEEQLVEEGVGSEDLPRSGSVGSVDVHHGGIEAESRDGHQFLAVVIRGANGAERRIHDQDVRAEAGPRRQEGHALRGGKKAEVEHPLVDLHRLDRTGLAGRLEVRVGGDRVEGDEAVDDLGQLAGRSQQADVGSAVRDHGEVGEVGTEDGPHGSHGLAPRAPAPDADGHARIELGHELVDAQSFISHGTVLSARWLRAGTGTVG